MINKDNFYKENQNMETPQELIDLTINKVENILKDTFPDYLSFGDGQFTLTHGSTQLMIIIRPFTNNETCIEILANVVSDGNITPEIMKFLLRKNSEPYTNPLSFSPICSFEDNPQKGIMLKFFRG